MAHTASQRRRDPRLANGTRTVHVLTWNEDLRYILELEGKWKWFGRKKDAERYRHGLAEMRSSLAPWVRDLEVNLLEVVVPQGADTDLAVWKVLSQPTSVPPNGSPEAEDHDIDVLPGDQPGDPAILGRMWTRITPLAAEDAEAIALSCMARIFADPEPNLALLRGLCLIQPIGATLEAMAGEWSDVPFDCRLEQQKPGQMPQDWLWPWDEPIQRLAHALISLRHHGLLAPAPLKNASEALDTALSSLYTDPVEARHRLEQALRNEYGAAAFRKLFKPWKGYGTPHSGAEEETTRRAAFRAAMQVYAPEAVASLPERHETIRSDGLPTLVFGCPDAEAAVRGHYVAASANGNDPLYVDIVRVEDGEWDAPGSRANAVWNRLRETAIETETEHESAYWHENRVPVLRFDLLARSEDDLSAQLDRFILERPWLADAVPAPNLVHRDHRVSERADRRTWCARSNVVSHGCLAYALPTAREIDLEYARLDRMRAHPVVAATATAPALYDWEFGRLLHWSYTREERAAWLRRTYDYTARFGVEVVEHRTKFPTGGFSVVMINPLTAEQRDFESYGERARAEKAAEWLRTISRTRSFKFLRRWTRHHEEVGMPREYRTPVYYTIDGLEV